MTEGFRVQHLLRERVAEEVRALLARKMMTGAELAEAIGRSPMYVSRRIRGEVAFDLDDMQHLAEVFGVEVGALIPKSVAASGPEVTGHYMQPVRAVEPKRSDPLTPRPIGRSGRSDPVRPPAARGSSRRPAGARPAILPRPR
jgi:transcriptional regulator with XRE-family HTH domain